MPHLRKMQIFVKLVEAGQITLAAQQLSLSKSTVSQSLSDLEKYLGLQLVKRNSRTLKLTESGQTYYKDCLRILADISASEDRVRDEAMGVAGSIRITASISFGSYILAPILVRFMAANPDITVQLLMSDQQADLITEGIDMALRVGELKDSGLLARKVGRGRMMMCAAPSFLERHGTPVSLGDLTEFECLRYTPQLHWILTERGVAHRFEPKGRMSMDSGETLRELAIAGQGLAYMPYIIAARAIREGKLVEIMRNHTQESLDIHLVRAAERHCPLRVMKLMHFITDDLKRGPSI